MRWSFAGRRKPSAAPATPSRRLSPAKLALELLEARETPAVIDLFNTTPPHVVSVTGSGTTTSSLGGLTGVVGGSREITIVNNGPNIAQNVTAVEINQTSSDAYDQNQTRPGSVVTTRWDGNANGSLDATGLGGIDLTNAGAQNAFRLNVLIDDLPAPVRFRVYTSATAYSDVTVNLPGDIYSSTPFVLPFNTFVTGSGATGPADLTNVGAVEMIVDGTAVALDLQLELLEAVGQVDLSLNKTVDDSTPEVGDVVTFSVTVSNRNAADIATAIDVKIRDVLPAGLTFISASGNGTYDAGTGIWDLTGTPIPRGGSQTLQIQARVTSSGSITNYAQVDSIGNALNPQIDTDSTPGDNSGRGQGGDPADQDDDDTETITGALLDFGDAPTAAQSGFAASYPTTIADNGARHIASGIRLGSTRDTEADGQPTANADGDGGDEDGITVTQLAASAGGPVTVVIPVVSSNGSGFLNAWFDFNRDGDWADAGEQVVTNFAMANGTNNVSVTIPAGTALGAVFARFRVTTASVASPAPTGKQNTGEVEDYQFTLVDPADLSLTKTIFSNPTPNLGENVVFEITVSNAGPSDATGVQVRDLLPAGLTYVSDNGAGAYVSGSGFWTIGALANGATATLQITARVTASGAITNYAQIVAGGPGDPDSTPGDGSTTQDDDDSVSVNAPALDFGDAPNTFGTTLASNGARHVATGPILGSQRDSENDGQPNAAATGDGADEDGVALSNLIPGINNTIPVTATQPGFIASFLNAWIDFNRDGDFNDANEQVLTNESIAAGSNTLTINVPAGATLGQTYARFRLTSASLVSPSPTGLEADGEVEDYQVSINNVADLSLTKTVFSNPTPNLGENVVFEITVSNAGPSDATGVQVRDLLPAGLTYVSDNGGGNYVPGTGVWTVGSISNGGTAVLQITAQVVAAGTSTNYAQITASDQFDPDSTPNDDSTTQDDDDSVDIVLAGLDFGDAPDSYGTLLASNGPRHVATGLTLGATRDSENDGQPNAAANGDGADEDGVTGIGTLTQGASNTITVNASAAGFVNAWIDFNHDGDFDDVGEQILSNAAVVAGNNDVIVVPPLDALTSYTTYARFRITSASVATPTPGGQAADGEVEDYALTVRQVADLSLTKVGSTATPLLGDTLTFTLTVANAGPNAATNVTVTDVLPAGLAYVSDDSGGAFNSGTGVWTVGTLASGANTAIVITVRVTGSGGITNTAQVSASDQFDPDSTPGDNSTNQDDDDSAALTVAQADFGDAPTPYPTLIVDNGARHVATGPTIGATRDTENDGQPNAGATGDGADEDGIVTGTLTIGTTQTISITTVGGGFVNAWIDFNLDGDWNDAGERVLTNRAVSTGANFVVIQIPLDALVGQAYGRFRLTSASVASPVPTGGLPDGEVEDYALTTQRLMDFGDAPDTYGTLLGSSGAGHVAIGTGPYLGTQPDVDADGQPSAAADGDGADEDGVTFGSLQAGVATTFTISAPLGGRLDAFVDWNGNGVFDSGERITAAGGTLLTPGTNTLNVTVPANATTNPTYARFRVSTTGGLGGTGLASDGEVEDYTLTIQTSFNTISGVVYVEGTQDGVRQAGEAGIAGVTVRLQGVDDLNQTIDRTTTTDNLGFYSFTNVRPGTYRLTETQPAYNDGLDAAGTPFGGSAAALGQDEISNIVIPNGSAGLVGTEYNFGERGTNLSGFVWVDADRDGVFDGGETGLGGVHLTLLDANGNVAASTTTQANGAYQFPNIATGNYTIVETQPDGYGSSTPNSLNVTVPSGGLTNQAFGETVSTLAGLVYVDANNNGVRDPSEPGIGGALVTLTGTDANGLAVTRSVSSALDGTYKFTNLLAGTYTVSETQPANYADLGDQLGNSGGTLGNDVFTAIPLGVAFDATGYNFGEGGTVVSGTVYVDANRNSTIDAGEQGLDGIQISLRNAAGSVVAITETAPDGTYAFNLTALGLPIGTYTISEVQPRGYGSSEAPTNSRTVNVPAGGVGNQNFGETTASISGFVYAATVSNDGVKQAGEPGIAGVLVRLTGTSATGGTVNLTATTAADGSYSFLNLPASNSAGYRLTETQPAGFADGKDLRGTINGTGVGTTGNDSLTAIVLGGGQQGVNYNFGELRPTGRTFVSGTVFTDTNVSGVRDAGETGIQGVTIRLLQGNTVVATTTTDVNGSYLFANLLPGNYTISETQPTAYDSTTANTLTVSVPAAGLLNQNFGEVNGSLAGSVYVDANNNGVRDAGELGIPGVVVRIQGTDANGAVDRTATTAADGSYRFAGLLAGAYTVTETQQPPGYADGTDAVGTANGAVGNDVLSAIILGQGVNATGYTFGELTSGLSGNVYVDLDNDGIRDANEPGIGGVVVTLTGPVTRTTTTAADGTYSFTDLVPGTYTVTETQPGAFADGADTAGSLNGTVGNDVISNIVLPANGQGTDYNFGERGTVVSGTVFVDGDNDGVRDPGEPGLGGVQLVLRDSTNTVIATTLTAADGSYVFPVSTPGDYTITETQPAGYGSNTPDVLTVAVPVGGLFNQDFSEITGSIAGVVYQDVNANGVRDAGENLPIGGVTLTLTGTDVNGLAVTRTTVSDAAGAWNFAGLLAGTYAVREAQPTNFFDSLEILGNNGGTVGNDVFTGIALAAGANATGYTFGETPPTDPFGFVFQDRNNNGVFDGTDTGIPGVTIRITGTVLDPNAPGGVRAFNPVTDDMGVGTGVRVTDAAGFYQFSALPQGTYRITETQPTAYADAREQMADPSDVALAAGSRIVVGNDVFSNIVLRNQLVNLPGGGVGNLALRGPLNFGETLQNTVAGRVFFDRNNTNRLDRGDVLLRGVRLTLTGRDILGNLIRRVVVTDANGNFRFTGLPPASAAGYQVTMTPPAGYREKQSFVGSLGGRRVSARALNVGLAGVQGANGLAYNFALQSAGTGKDPFIGR